MVLILQLERNGIGYSIYEILTELLAIQLMKNGEFMEIMEFCTIFDYLLNSKTFLLHVKLKYIGMIMIDEFFVSMYF